MRVIFAGGGTGGHLFPAVALAQLLLQQDERAEVLFVGTERGIEQRLLPKLGLPLVTVDMVGLLGRGWRGRLEVGPRLVKSLIQSLGIIRKFKPDLVVGVGGYASVPLALAAKILGIPLVIHEQNATPGLSNRVLGRLSNLVCLSYANSAERFGKANTLVTGNPLRAGFSDVSAALPEQVQILVFGGSRGARAINQAVTGMLAMLKQLPQQPFILHQTGEDDFESVARAYRDAGYGDAKVVPFIDDMVNAYEQSQLVICRSGATTLAELTCCGRPALLIPFPYATGDHQTTNAMTLVDAGAAVMIAQRELNGETLATEVASLLADKDALQKMAARGRKLGRPDAGRKILAECRAIVMRNSVEVS